MKIVLRTLAILAAALLVVAGLTAFGQSSYGQALVSAGPGGMERQAPPALADQASDGFTTSLPSAERRGGEGHGPSLFGLVEVGKNLAIIAVSVTLIALGARLLRFGRRDEPGAVPPDEPAPL